MKVAIPIFRSRVSPVFDWSTRLLLVRIPSGPEETREEIEVGGLDLLERVERLSNAGADVLICGAISNFLARLLESKGIKITPWIAGDIEDVIHALASDEFPHDRFLMPGCRQRERRGMGYQEREGPRQERSVHPVTSQQIKLGHSKDGNPKVLAHDCSKCKRPGMCADETPVTLDDIRRIVDNSDISWEVFFRDKVEPKPIKYRGLGMKRGRHCIFFREGIQCSIEEVKPMHCRFTPCPIRVHSDEEYACYYYGSGTVEQQFRHQIALAFTREYVQEHGVAYNKEAVDKCLKKIDKFFQDSEEFEKFCERISCYRYVEDTSGSDEKV